MEGLEREGALKGLFFLLSLTYAAFRFSATPAYAVLNCINK
jgi:hypothetical protein